MMMLTDLIERVIPAGWAELELEMRECDVKGKLGWLTDVGFISLQKFRCCSIQNKSSSGVSM